MQIGLLLVFGTGGIENLVLLSHDQGVVTLVALLLKSPREISLCVGWSGRFNWPLLEEGLRIRPIGELICSS